MSDDETPKPEQSGAAERHLSKEAQSIVDMLSDIKQIADKHEWFAATPDGKNKLLEIYAKQDHSVVKSLAARAKDLTAVVSLLVAVAGLVTLKATVVQQLALADGQENLTKEQLAIREGQAVLEDGQNTIVHTQDQIELEQVNIVERQISLKYTEHLSAINALRGSCGSELLYQPIEQKFWPLWREYINCYNGEMANQVSSKALACAAHQKCDVEFESLYGIMRSFDVPPEEFASSPSPTP